MTNNCKAKFVVGFISNTEPVRPSKPPKTKNPNILEE